jgi:hypothetical protein
MSKTMITTAVLPILAVFLTLVMTGQFTSAETDFRTLSQHTSTQPDGITGLKTDMIKVGGVEYLVVNTPSGVGVCFAMTKNNFKRIGELVGELEGEINAEKLNRILQNNK